METTFRGMNQMRRFEELSHRNIGMTLYYDEPTMDTLGIKDRNSDPFTVNRQRLKQYHHIENINYENSLKRLELPTISPE